MNTATQTADIIKLPKFSAHGDMAYSLQFAPPTTFDAAICGLNDMGDFFDSVTDIANRIDRKVVKDAATTARFLGVMLMHHYALIAEDTQLMDRVDTIVDAQPYWGNCHEQNSLSIVEVVHMVAYLRKTITMISALVEKDDAKSHGFGLSKLFSKKR